MHRARPYALAVVVTIAVTIGPGGRAQSYVESARRVLASSIQPVAVTAYQVQRYLMARMPKLAVPQSSDQAARDDAKLRRHILDDIVFHGWPREWVNAGPHFEEVGAPQPGPGYHWRKLRYEIVPGFWSTAILYEPESSAGKSPAVLYVEGHEREGGKSVEYAQKACINFARRGIVTMNLEWLEMGELNREENAHDMGAQLDLVGTNALGLFYLEMRKGIDYLASLPQVDASRLGMTGLSGGGWQTITLSSLDPRVAVMVEVAGFGSLDSNIIHAADTDEVEETPTDFLAGEDYTNLVALRAPRPTLLIHNGEDDCCFRAMLVKPYIFDKVEPYFRAFGQEQNFAWYENRDPGTHNYQIDNRLQAYRFFAQHFGLPPITEEIPSGPELKTFDELKVGLPEDNLTTLALAKKLAAQIARPAAPTDPAGQARWATGRRPVLKSVLRYQPVTVANAWRMWNTKDKGLETLSYRFDFSNDLSATAVWLREIAVAANVPATIVINDQGRKAATDDVFDRLVRGDQVLALDVIFNGEMIPQRPNPTDYELLVASMGERPLGLEVGQLIGAAKWLTQNSGQAQIRLQATGPRSQVVALAAAALEPQLFSEIVTKGGMHSLQFLLDTPVKFRQAPELFCLDLYKEFDLDQLRAMAVPTKLSEGDFAKSVAEPASETSDAN